MRRRADTGNRRRYSSWAARKACQIVAGHWRSVADLQEGFRFAPASQSHQLVAGDASTRWGAVARPRRAHVVAAEAVGAGQADQPSQLTARLLGSQRQLVDRCYQKRAEGVRLFYSWRIQHR